MGSRLRAILPGLVFALITLAPLNGFSQTAASSSNPSASTHRVSSATTAASSRFQQKLDWLQKNGQQAHPDQRPTTFTQDELNAYVAAGPVKLPEGVENLVFALAPGAVSANMQVDFDVLAARSSNPLLSLFSGTHQVLVKAHGAGSGGVARAHIDSVALDGSAIPRFILQMFVEKMLQPKYSQASLDPVIKLPEKIDLLELGTKQATVTQK